MAKKPNGESNPLEKANAYKEIFRNFESDVQEPSFHARVYRIADETGFKDGCPVFQGGLAPEGLRNITLRITSENGHVTVVTMGKLLNILSLATVRALWEVRDERKSTPSGE